VFADEFTAIHNLNISFPGKSLQGGRQFLRGDIRCLSRGRISLSDAGHRDDGKIDRGGDHAYAHNAPSFNAVSASMEIKSELAGKMNTS
jgi:hypothetical protein